MRIFLVVTLTAILALSMGGQQKAQQPAAIPTSGVTFSSNTNLVVVDVTVIVAPPVAGIDAANRDVTKNAAAPKPVWRL